MAQIRKITTRISHWFNWVAGFSLVAMMTLVVVNVLLRNLARVRADWFPDPVNAFFTAVKPISGTVEMVGLLGVAVAAFAIAYTFVEGGHVAIDYLVSRAPARLAAVIRSITYFFGAALFALLAWESIMFAGDLMASGEVTPTRQIPFYPFVWGITLACLPVVVLLFLDFLKAVSRAVRR